MLEGTEKERVMAKVKALLELGASDNEHEAKLAMQRAGEIMAKYEISVSQLTLKEKEDVENQYIDLMAPDGSNRVTWEGSLAGVVAWKLDCAVIIVGRKKLSFIGFSRDLELVDFYFRYLRRNIGVVIWDMKTIKKQYSYAMGFIAAIGERLDAMKREKEKVMNESGCTSLVLAKNTIVKDATKKLHPNVNAGTNKEYKNDQSAFNSGYKDGKEIALGRPVSNGGDRESVTSGRIALNG